MQLTADQALRKELLLFALTKQTDLTAAFEMAAEMERFVLEGPTASREAPADAQVAAGAADDDCGMPPMKEAAPAFGAYGAGGTKRRWSEEDDDAFTALWQSAASLEEIAETLERTTPSLYCRARALGLAKRAPQPKDQATPAPQSAAQVSAVEDHADERPEAGLDADAQAAFAVPRGAEVNDMKVERYRVPRTPGRHRPGQARAVKDSGGFSARTVTPIGKTTSSYGEEMGVDSIVQFLRSRDYSVVRIGEGRFRLDGRRELSVDELRDKANKVRKLLGQPPFRPLGAEAVNY